MGVDFEEVGSDIHEKKLGDVVGGSWVNLAKASKVEDNLPVEND